MGSAGKREGWSIWEGSAYSAAAVMIYVDDRWCNLSVCEFKNKDGEEPASDRHRPQTGNLLPPTLSRSHQEHPSPLSHPPPTTFRNRIAVIRRVQPQVAEVPSTLILNWECACVCTQWLGEGSSWVSLLWRHGLHQQLWRNHSWQLPSAAVERVLRDARGCLRWEGVISAYFTAVGQPRCL